MFRTPSSFGAPFLSFLRSSTILIKSGWVLLWYFSFGELSGIQYLHPFTNTTIPKNGLIDFPTCGETERTWSSTLARFLMYFMSTVYKCSSYGFTLLPPVSQNQRLCHPMTTQPTVPYLRGRAPTFNNSQLFMVGLPSLTTHNYFIR